MEGHRQISFSTLSLPICSFTLTTVPHNVACSLLSLLTVYRFLMVSSLTMCIKLAVGPVALALNWRSTVVLLALGVVTGSQYYCGNAKLPLPSSFPGFPDSDKCSQLAAGSPFLDKLLWVTISSLSFTRALSNRTKSSCLGLLFVQGTFTYSN